MGNNKLFERKAYSEMQDWKRNLADRYALMVEGARRVVERPWGKVFWFHEDGLCRNPAHQEVGIFRIESFALKNGRFVGCVPNFVEAQELRIAFAPLRWLSEL